MVQALASMVSISLCTRSGGRLVMVAVPHPVIRRVGAAPAGGQVSPERWLRSSTWPISWPIVHCVAPLATTAPGCPSGCTAHPLNAGTVARTKYTATSSSAIPSLWANSEVCSAVGDPLVHAPTSMSMRSGRLRRRVDRSSTLMPAVSYTCCMDASDVAMATLGPRLAIAMSRSATEVV